MRGLSLVVASGATLRRSARAFHRHGLSCCGAQAPVAQAQWLWLTGPVAPRHMGSSQTRARTRVPCIGRQTLNHWASREALFHSFLWLCNSIVYIYHIFIHSSVDGHLGYFHVLAIVNSAAVNTGVHVSFRVWFFPGVCPGVGLLDHMVVLLLVF